MPLKFLFRFAHLQHDRSGMKYFVHSLSLQKNKVKLSEITQRLKTVTFGFHLSSRRNFLNPHLVDLAISDVPIYMELDNGIFVSIILEAV